jgi:hypothetical protein
MINDLWTGRFRTGLRVADGNHRRVTAVYGRCRVLNFLWVGLLLVSRFVARDGHGARRAGRHCHQLSLTVIDRHSLGIAHTNLAVIAAIFLSN